MASKLLLAWSSSCPILRSSSCPQKRNCAFPVNCKHMWSLASLEILRCSIRQLSSASCPQTLTSSDELWQRCADNHTLLILEHIAQHILCSSAFRCLHLNFLCPSSLSRLQLISYWRYLWTQETLMSWKRTRPEKGMRLLLIVLIWCLAQRPLIQEAFATMPNDMRSSRYTRRSRLENHNDLLCHSLLRSFENVSVFLNELNICYLARETC